MVMVMVMMMMIMPPALNKYPLTPAHSRSLPLTPAHSRSLPLTPAHSRSLPLTLTPAPTLARAAFTRDHGFLVASALRSLLIDLARELHTTIAISGIQRESYCYGLLGQHCGP
jgi:hypothetical protein